jgi:hypothetical protein
MKIDIEKNMVNLIPENDQETDDNIVLEDGKYYCGICNKLIDLKTGDEVPVCCGLRMEEVE